jgi:hypothetical protein
MPNGHLSRARRACCMPRGHSLQANFLELRKAEVPRISLPRTPVNKAPAGHRASGRGTMEADAANTTKEVLRAFPTAARDRRERS